MKASTLNVLLIEDSPQYARLVQQWLSSAGVEDGFLLNWTDSLAAAISRLERGGIDVILLDLGLPDCSGIESFAQTRAKAPKTPILILSSADNESLALQLIQEGAEDYLVKSSCDAEALLRAIRRAVVRRKSQAHTIQSPAVPSRIIGVLGVKGGVGTTTIACNLASAVRQQTNQKVLLADLDSNGGLVSFLMGIECAYSMGDAVKNLQRLDLSCWESILGQGPDDLHIISSAGLAGGEMKSGNLRGVLSFTQALYPWTVIDFGRLDQETSALLDMVDEVLLVTTNAIPALYSAKRMIKTLETKAIEADRIRLIVNQGGAVRAFSGNDLRTMFGVPVYATVPEDGEELHESCVQKQLPGKDSQIHRAISGLARKLTGLPEQPVQGKLKSLVSLAERFRKPTKGVAVSLGSPR